MCDPELCHFIAIFLHVNTKFLWWIFTIEGNYFGAHFIMGGERFDTPQPEAYLFGENSDLNFLGSRPTAVIISLFFLR